MKNKSYENSLDLKKYRCKISDKILLKSFSEDIKR